MHRFAVGFGCNACLRRCNDGDDGHSCDDDDDEDGIRTRVKFTRRCDAGAEDESSFVCYCCGMMMTTKEG